MTRSVRWLTLVPVALLLGCAGPPEDPKVALEKAEAAAKEAGAMMSLEEIRKAVAVPEGDNAWPVYQRAKEALTDQRTFTRAAAAASRGRTDGFAEIWAAESKATGLLFQAVQKPGCDPKLPWDALTIDNTREASDLGLWSGALGAYAQTAAQTGQTEEAVKCLDAMVAIVRHVDSGGAAMAVLNGTTYAELMAACRRVLKDLDALPFPAVKALKIDASLATRAQVDPKTPARRTGTKLEAQSEALTEADDAELRSRILVLNRFVEAIRFMDKPSLEPRATWLAAQETSARWDAVTGPEVADADQFRPPLLSLAQGLCRRAARVRCAETALDMIEAHQKTGSWPAQPPTQREDPFSGKPLLWSLEDGTLAVWSVAVDGRDAGGSERDDLVVKATLPAPKAGS
jgi:hypothetical protein